MFAFRHDFGLSSVAEKPQGIIGLEGGLQEILRKGANLGHNYIWNGTPDRAKRRGFAGLNARKTGGEETMSTYDTRLFLRRVPLFYSLTEAQIDLLSVGSARRSFPKGRTIVAEGEPSQSLYILLSGRAKVQRSDSEGKEVIIAVLGAGEFFGEMSLIDDEPRSASVITLEACDFLAIPKENFLAALRQSTEICLTVMRGLVKRLRSADRNIETLALLDVYGRVARVLLDSSELIGNERIVRNRLPRQQIAKMVGASREMVSRVMKGLETEGYIVPLENGRTLLRDKLSLYL